jgi:hypothetical protein
MTSTAPMICSPVYLRKKLRGFKITTPDGFVYKFGFYGQTYNSNADNSPVEKSTDFFAQGYNYKGFDSWYLREVESPDKKNTVFYEYGKLQNVWAPIVSLSKSITMDQFDIPDHSSKQVSDMYSGSLFSLFILQKSKRVMRK